MFSNSSQNYIPIPTEDGVEAGRHGFSLPTKNRRNHKVLLFLRAFAAIAIMFALYTSIKERLWSFWGEFYGECYGFGGLPSHFELPSGAKIPSVALGVWQAEKGKVGEAVSVALKAGYRHIDGAWIYGNEEEVGKAIEESGVARSDLFITSKLWNKFHDPADVETALDESLKRLGTTYVDLYLIHWPVAFKKESGPDGKNIIDRELTANLYATWKAMEDLVDKGKAKNIGVSNFNIRRMQNLTSYPLKYKPAVNQVELNFWNPQPELLEWSKKHGILLESYSPLGSDKQVGASLNVPEVKEIAHKLKITPAQVLISWAVQRGTVVLPKSVTPSRVRENLKISKLPKDLFEKLETAACSHPPKRVVNPSESWGLGYDIFDEEYEFR